MFPSFEKSLSHPKHQHIQRLSYCTNMFPKRFAAVILFALCFVAACATPVPTSSAVELSKPDVAVRNNVGGTINKEIGKASRTFKLSRTAVIAIAISCSVAVFLLICCLVSCCCKCFSCFK